MSKIKAEDCYSISTHFLKKHGYFNSKTYTSGNVTWSLGEKVLSEVGVTVDIRLMTIEFDYRTRNRYSGEEWKMKHYVVNLRTTSCHFGGKRYWVDCRFCRKRVGTLYLYEDNDFACRHCLRLTYESRTARKRLGLAQVFKHYELEEQIDSLRVKYYNGKPTRRYVSLLKKAELCLPDEVAVEELEKLCREIAKISV